MFWLLLFFLDTPKIYYGFDLKPGSLIVSKSEMPNVKVGQRLSKVKGKSVRSLRYAESLVEPEDTMIALEFIDRETGESNSTKLGQRVRGWKTANWLKMPLKSGAKGLIGFADLVVTAIPRPGRVIAETKIYAASQVWEGTATITGIETKGVSVGQKIRLNHGADITIQKVKGNQLTATFNDPGMTQEPRLYAKVSGSTRSSRAGKKVGKAVNANPDH